MVGAIVAEVAATVVGAADKITATAAEVMVEVIAVEIVLEVEKMEELDAATTVVVPVPVAGTKPDSPE
jgi:hypothetical protein